MSSLLVFYSIFTYVSSISVICSLRNEEMGGGGKRKEARIRSRFWVGRSVGRYLGFLFPCPCSASSFWSFVIQIGDRLGSFIYPSILGTNRPINQPSKQNNANNAQSTGEVYKLPLPLSQNEKVSRYIYNTLSTLPSSPFHLRLFIHRLPLLQVHPPCPHRRHTRPRPLQ